MLLQQRSGKGRPVFDQVKHKPCHQRSDFTLRPAAYHRPHQWPCSIRAQGSARHWVVDCHRDGDVNDASLPHASVLKLSHAGR